MSAVVSLLEGCRQARLSRQPSAAVQPPLNSPIKQPGIAANCERWQPAKPRRDSELAAGLIAHRAGTWLTAGNLKNRYCPKSVLPPDQRAGLSMLPHSSNGSRPVCCGVVLMNLRSFESDVAFDNNRLKVYAHQNLSVTLEVEPP